MSESWMPGDDPPLARLIFDRDKFRDGEPYPLRIHEETRLRRLFEITALKAQIEALEEWAEHDTERIETSIGYVLEHVLPSGEPCLACCHLKHLRARLAELEGK